MKKKIPLSILETLQPIADKNTHLVKVIKDQESMFHLKDNDLESDFYLKITKQESRSGRIHYLVEHKPKSKDNVNPHSLWMQIENITEYIQKWLSLLESYNKIHTVYDDPIIKINQERFEKQFDIIDEDADVATFDLSQQLYLDDYLNTVKSKIPLLKEGRSNEEIRELEEIEKEAVIIQKNLSKETKRKIIKRLTYLWAKSQKLGIDVIKEIFVGTVAELTKRLLIG